MEGKKKERKKKGEYRSSPSSRFIVRASFVSFLPSLLSSVSSRLPLLLVQHRVGFISDFLSLFREKPLRRFFICIRLWRSVVKANVYESIRYTNQFVISTFSPFFTIFHPHLEFQGNEIQHRSSFPCLEELLLQRNFSSPFNRPLLLVKCRITYAPMLPSTLRLVTRLKPNKNCTCMCSEEHNCTNDSEKLSLM